MTKTTGLRVGVAIGHDRVAAVAMKSSRVVAFSEATFASADELRSALARTLAGVSSHSLWRRVDAHVALEAHSAQVRRVAGVPLLANRGQLHAIAHLARAEHFLGRPDDLSVFVGEQESDGGLWVLCTSTELVREIASSITAARMSLARIVPAIDVVCAAGNAVSGEFSRADGPDVSAIAQMTDGRLTKTWRALNVTAVSVVAMPSLPAADVANSGRISDAEVPCYSAAIAAASGLARARFSAPTMLSVPAHRSRKRHLWLEAALAASLTIAAIVAPVSQVHRESVRVAAAIEAMLPGYRADARRRLTLDSLKSRYSAIARFRLSGTRALTLMTALGDALDDDGKITDLVIDSAGAQVTLVTANAGDLLQRLGTVSGVDSVLLTGPISRERIAEVTTIPGPGLARGGLEPTRELERAAFRVFATSFERGSGSSVGPKALPFKGTRDLLARATPELRSQP